MSDRWPVIVGVGEIVDRPTDPMRSLEPIALMAEALHRADEDAGGGLLAKLDSLDLVHQVSWRYERTADALCARLGIRPARAVYGMTGGESPMRYLHEAALRIVRGESEVAAIVGAEAQYAVNKAREAKIELPWTPIAANVENPFPTEGRITGTMQAHGALRPIHVYPFYENASHVDWGQTPLDARRESAELYARFSRIAAANPYSWSRNSLSADDLLAVSDRNRWICHPYTKLFVANPAVNQGAAVLLTSLARARAANIDESKLIFLWGGCSAMEPRNYLQRDQYLRSDAQDVVLNATRRLAHDNGREIEARELYSCFPCVPKMTRRVLGLPRDTTPTVTGGLSFFGAPLNNYMTHATCAMVRHLREENARTGLLYGQGEFITKHHALVVSKHPPRHALSDHYSVQDEVDKRRGNVPTFVEDFAGRATIETFTLIYDRGRDPYGVVIARTEGSRMMARIPMEASADLNAMVDEKASPIGRRVEVFRLDALRLGCRLCD